jgi:hypothetical protein
MTMNNYMQFFANATVQALALLDAKEVDREALRAILINLHAAARDQAMMTRPDSPRYLDNRLKRFRVL